MSLMQNRDTLKRATIYPFACIQNQGFTLTFANNYKVVVMFGPKNLCGNFDTTKSETYPLSKSIYGSDDAQVYIYYGDTEITDQIANEYNINLTSMKSSSVASLFCAIASR